VRSGGGRLLAGLLLLACLLASNAEAGQNRWTPFGIGGGTVFSLAVDPTVPGVVYAAALSGGIYRSADAGRTWQWRGVATTSLVVLWTDVIVSPTDPQRLYATAREGVLATTGRLYTSSDGGAHWQELFHLPDAGLDAVAASPNGTLLVASEESEVYRSVDGGQTWNLALDPEIGSLNNPRLAFDPLAPETAYVGALGGLWQSTDSGATWRKIETLAGGEPVEGVSELAFPGTRPGFFYVLMSGRLFRSEDGGLTWSGGAPVTGARDIAVDPADPQTVYAVGLLGFVSHDGGDTAAEVPFPSLGPLDVRFAIAASPAAPATLYVATDEGVVVSADAGEHWTLGEQRGMSSRHFEPFDFLAAPSGRLYQEPLDDGVILRSLDRGATWTSLAPVPFPPPPGLLLGLTEEAGAPGHLWVTSDSGFLLFHSTDGGVSWKSVRLPTASSEVVSPAPRVVLAGGCGLERTADGGRTWKRFFTCAPQRGEIDIVHRLGVPPGWSGAVWAEVELRRSGRSTWKVLLSRDSGKTWRTVAQSTESFPRLRAAAARKVIYLQRNDTLQRSNDAGATWIPVGVPGPFLNFAVDAADPDVVYLATLGRGVLRSTDGGQTWSEANAGLAGMGRLWILDVVTDPKVPSTAYAFPVIGGLFQARFGD